MSKKTKAAAIARLAESVKRLFPLNYKCNSNVYKREYQGMMDLLAKDRITSDNTAVIAKKLIDFIEDLGYIVIEEQLLNSGKNADNPGEVTYLIMEEHGSTFRRYGLSYWNEAEWSPPSSFDNYLELLERIELDVRSGRGHTKGQPYQGFRIYEYYRNGEDVDCKTLAQWQRMPNESCSGGISAVLEKVSKLKKQFGEI